MAGEIGSNVSGGEWEDRKMTDAPPVDDCCPICFGGFHIPCKTNCGHWYCAQCILQYWNSRASLKQCKCPICSRFINKMKPEASLLVEQEEEIVETLKRIQQYNRLYVGGVFGIFLKVCASPLFFKRFLQDLTNPDSFGNNWQRMRVFAYLIGFVYNLSHFRTIPTGSFQAKWVIFQARVDLWLASLVIILHFFGLFQRWQLRRRVRRLATEGRLDE